MNLERAFFEDVEIKADGGEFRAVFSTFRIPDHDGDVVLETAVRSGQTVPISHWNHSSWGAYLPIGTATVTNDGVRAIAHGTFFQTSNAQETREVVRALGKLQLGQWSYGYLPTKVSFDPSELAEYGPTAKRILKSVMLFEISPVLVGASIATETLEAAGLAADPELAHIAAQVQQQLYDDSRELIEIATSLRGMR